MSMSQNSDDYSKITDNLYIGNINSLQDASKFDMIVNCTQNIPFPTIPKKSYVRIPVNDTPIENDNLLKFVKNTNVLEQIHEFRSNDRNILVHCHAGMQRSCAIVALYFMKHYNVTPVRAMDFIKSKRNIAFYPEATFQDALNRYYRELNNSV